MKRQTTITWLMGITQLDVALLLGIHRSQWSMFECGQRDLPLPAQQLLAEVLAHINTPENIAQSAPQNSRQLAKRNELEALLKENEFQQLRINKEITPLKDKQESRVRMLLLVDFLTRRNTENNLSNNSLLAALTGKVSEQSIKEDEVVLTRLLIKQEMLLLEKLIIESQIHKIPAAIENSDNN